MAQINLTFTELIDITSCIQFWAEEIQPIDRQEWHRLMSLCSELHRRFAETATTDDYNVEDLHVEVHPDAQIPDSIYAPDPEDFSEEVTTHD